MPMPCKFHALVLNLHQPSGNLSHLLEAEPWEARQTLCALDRIPRSLWGHEDRARVHLSLSGTLLEALSDSAFQERVYGMVRLGDMLWHFQNRALIEVLGTGYYHPVFPLIEPEDRVAQVERWQGIGRHLFWRTEFQGFWPPEMGFCMEMIPLLQRRGYRYVLVSADQIVPVTPMRWPDIRYRPHWARHGDAKIIVIPRDRELSTAQESGMDPDWFIREVAARTRDCHFPPLVITATDGDNGGWFRNMTPGQNFWGAFYLPYLDRVRRDESGGLRPTFIHEYLDAYPPQTEVIVRTGAWNTGEHSGTGFVQWTGSARQREALSRVREVSRTVRAARARVEADVPPDPRKRAQIEEAYGRVLRAETSCNFFWGEAWVQRCHDDLDAALARLPG